jgi:chromosome segregation ATPase
MWNDDKQARFDTLRECGPRGSLTEAERAELDALTRELDALEAACLSPATERIRQERQTLEAQNRGLEELLGERKAYLARVRGVVAELDKKDRQWRQRFSAITGRACSDG